MTLQVQQINYPKSTTIINPTEITVSDTYDAAEQQARNMHLANRQTTHTIHIGESGGKDEHIRFSVLACTTQRHATPINYT